MQLWKCSAHKWRIPSYKLDPSFSAQSPGRTLKSADRCLDRTTLERSPPGDNPDRAVSEAISAASAEQPAFALAFTARDDYVEILKFLGRQILKFTKHLGVVITGQPVAELGFA